MPQPRTGLLGPLTLSVSAPPRPTPPHSQSIWNYCSFDDSMMIDFAFKVYDIDASDSLSYSEMYHLVKEVYGIQPKGSLEPRVAQLMEKMGVGSGTSGGGKVSMETFSGKVSLERFTSFNAQFPMLLMPAYLLQQNL